MCRSPLALTRDVDARVARQQVEHVVEEADAGRDRRRAGAVEIDRDLDVGFLGGPLHGRLAHLSSPARAARVVSGLCALRQPPRAIALSVVKS